MPAPDAEPFVLTFGSPLTAADHARARREARPVRMRTLYGPGPEGARCGDCVHLLGRAYANTYFKCALYGVSNGRATDWCKTYRACGRVTDASR